MQRKPLILRWLLLGHVLPWQLQLVVVVLVLIVIQVISILQLQRVLITLKVAFNVCCVLMYRRHWLLAYLCIVLRCWIAVCRILKLPLFRTLVCPGHLPQIRISIDVFYHVVAILVLVFLIILVGARPAAISAEA